MFFWQAGLGLIVLEIITFGVVIDEIGFFQTLLLWICTAMLGGWLVRGQGMATLIRAQASFDRGAVPVDDLFDSFCLFIAGALFILPGFISDSIAFMLLIPPFRKMLRVHLPKKFGLREDAFKHPDDGVIDGSYVRVEDSVDVIEPFKNPPQA